ncbi:MAG: hypothetical protein IPL98_19555 [Saprospiraceae bacterium]|nr:hypothetical protein [Saprospiraceae bacterium]
MEHFLQLYQEGLTRFEMGATAADTTLGCEGDFVINTRTALTGVINQGVSRGGYLWRDCWIFFLYTNAAAPCNTTIQGNGVLGIDVRSARRFNMEHLHLLLQVLS